MHTLLSVKTLAFTASLAMFTGAPALASEWSPASGPSLFQTLGIELPNGAARSQILPRIDTNLVNIDDQDSALSMSAPSLSAPSLSAPSMAHPIQSAAATLPGDPELADAQTVDMTAPPLPDTVSPQTFGSGVAAITDPVQIAQIEQVPDMQMEPVGAPAMLPAENLWGALLGTYVNQDASGLNRFDYAGLAVSAQDMQNLDTYIKDLAGEKPSAMPRAQAMAYWANLYNALTVQVVAQNYPVSSIRKIKSGRRKGPWKRNLVTVEGDVLSLDDIEHGIMRPTFKTPLVHYMVNCASVGCPNLKPSPWRAGTLDADLDAAARAFINSPRGISLAKGRTRASSIYKWFKKDFGGNDAGVLAHLIQYAEPDLAAQLAGRKKIDKFGYDWNVNAAN